MDGSPPGTPSLGFSRREHWNGLPFPSPIHESEDSQPCPTQRPRGPQPTRLVCPWDCPGKSSRAGCHCLLLKEGINSHIRRVKRDLPIWHLSPREIKRSLHVLLIRRLSRLSIETTSRSSSGLDLEAAARPDSCPGTAPSQVCRSTLEP